MNPFATHFRRNTQGLILTSTIILLTTTSNSFATTNPSQNYLDNELSTNIFSFYETTETAEIILVGLSNRFMQTYEFGNYPVAYDIANRAYQIAKQTFGVNNIHTADSLLKLGITNQIMGEMGAAEKNMLESLIILEDQLNPDHPDIAIILTNLGNIYLEMEDSKKSEHFYKKALMIRENAFDPDDPSIAQSIYNLAMLYKNDHKYEKAAQLYQQAIKLWTKIYGPNHPYVGSALSNLTNTYTAQSKYSEATIIQHRTVAYNKSVFGLEHQEVAQSLVDLGALYLEQEQYNPATNAYKEALNIAEHILSSSDPQLALLMYALANVYHTQAHNTGTITNITTTNGHTADSLFAQALPLYEKAAKILDTKQNRNKPVLEIVLSELALLYKEIGDIDKAIATESRLSPNHE